MQNDNFSEKLYTSTEVAEILGVSLRSIYRYLDENKIQAAVKTATGRHRFTRQNINDFLHPGSNSDRPVARRQDERETRDETYYKPSSMSDSRSEMEYPANDQQVMKNSQVGVETEEVDADTVKEEPVDWLARFRQAAEKYKTQEEEESMSNPVSTPQRSSAPRGSMVSNVAETVEEEIEADYRYYRSGVGGLKEIAQSLDKSAKNASLDYAFTMNAGLSLHKPIKPFSLIHSYVRPQDLGYFEKVLQLTPSQKDTAQLCLIPSNDSSLYNQRREMHGLYVVSDSQIKLDLLNEGETDLANELE